MKCLYILLLPTYINHSKFQNIQLVLLMSLKDTENPFFGKSLVLYICCDARMEGKCFIIVK
jgi:hypothetical protein